MEIPVYILIIDAAGVLLVLCGFILAFRQRFLRGLLGRGDIQTRADGGQDPLGYALRIAGVMLMAFGLGGAGMVTLFYLN